MISCLNTSSFLDHVPLQPSTFIHNISKNIFNTCSSFQLGQFKYYYILLYISSSKHLPLDYCANSIYSHPLYAPTQKLQICTAIESMKVQVTEIHFPFTLSNIISCICATAQWQHSYMAYGWAPLTSADCRLLASPLGEAPLYIQYPSSTPDLLYRYRQHTNGIQT